LPFLIAAKGLEIVETVRLENVPEPAQIARYSPDGDVLLVTSVRSGTATLIDPAFRRQTTIAVGKQPMDAAFHDGLLFVACQGDGTVHVIDGAAARVAHRFLAGVGCETLAFF
jgi:YVTN family beta-propeller protein